MNHIFVKRTITFNKEVAHVRVAVHHAAWRMRLPVPLQIIPPPQRHHKSLRDLLRDQVWVKLVDAPQREHAH